MNSYAQDLIKQFEGCSLNAYLDSGGIPTIGYGHTGKYIKLGMRITQDEANTFLSQDLASTEKEIKNIIKVKLTPKQLGAVIAFSYNVGINAFKGSTLLKFINSSQLNLAANEFLKWNKVNGKVINGLTRRRQAERDLFTS